jgi:hypothetical protein
MANIEKFTEDLAIVQKLGDNPNTDNGLSASELKERFDAAALLIQKYINDTLVPAVNGKMGTDGGALKGNIAMSGHRVTNLGNPVDDGDAVPKGYMTKDNLGLGKVDNTPDSEKNVAKAENADAAAKLATPVIVLVNLGSGQSASFDGSKNINPGVSGILPMSNGGMGADNGSAGLKNLLEAGPMVLSPHQYGDTLPEPGIPGRIFFLKVSD